jgi:Fe-Mn family superoxide dismutase
MENTIQNWEQMTYPFTNLTLNYNLNALEPYIDTRTMHEHYDLLADYIKNLNQIIATRIDLQNMNLIDLLNYAVNNQDIDLHRQAGGVYNHFFFFSELRPATGQIIIGITPQATNKIIAAFGGWKNFKEKFAEVSLNFFGSGYTWLIKNNKNELKIITTTNQEVPLGCTPILCLDIWEHAYYLQHLKKRHTYIDAFWNIVDWVKFSEKL